MIIEKINKKEVNELKKVCKDSKFLKTYQKFFEKHMDTEINDIQLSNTRIFDYITRWKNVLHDFNKISTNLKEIEKKFKDGVNQMKKSIDKNPEILLQPLITKLAQIIGEVSPITPEESSTISSDPENSQKNKNFYSVEVIKAYFDKLWGHKIVYNKTSILILRYTMGKDKENNNLHIEMKNESYLYFLVKTFCKSFEQSCQILMDDNEKKEDLLNFLDLLKATKDKGANNNLKASDYYANDTLIPIAYILYAIIVEYRLQNEGHDFLSD